MVALLGGAVTPAPALCAAVAFSVFDVDRDGKVSHRDLFEILRLTVALPQLALAGDGETDDEPNESTRAVCPLPAPALSAAAHRCYHMMRLRHRC